MGQTKFDRWYIRVFDFLLVSNCLDKFKREKFFSFSSKRKKMILNIFEIVISELDRWIICIIKFQFLAISFYLMKDSWHFLTVSRRSEIVIWRQTTTTTKTKSKKRIFSLFFLEFFFFLIQEFFYFLLIDDDKSKKRLMQTSHI
mgnify:CR=1 FL=1